MANTPPAPTTGSAQYVPPLTHRTAVVTGGGTGIGLGIAYALAGAGARVAIAGRRHDVLSAAAAVWHGPITLLHHPVDVADRSSVQTLIDWGLRELSRFDIWVNAAGVNIPNRTMATMQPADWDHLLAINATGVFNCMYAVLPHMRSQQNGLIVNISSTSGKRASELGGIAYCASKFAMAGLSTAVGQEEARHGIRVTTVYPGEVDTPILEARPVPVSAAHREKILKPADVGQLVAALAALPPLAHVPEVIIKPISQMYG